jgi:hypothetical protein
MAGQKRERELHYFSYFKKLYESWERSMSQALEVWLKNPLVTNSTEKAIEKSIEFRNYIYEIMDRSLQQRVFPMKDDMDKVLGSLDILETKLNKLSKRMDELEVDEKSISRRKITKSKIRRKKGK